MPFGLQNRFVLLLLLLPLIALAAWLVLCVNEPSGFYSMKQNRLTWHDSRFGKTKYFELSFANGTVREISKYEDHNEDLPKNLHGELVWFGSHTILNKASRTWDLQYSVEVIDPDAFERKRWAGLKLPSLPKLFAGRFAVARSGRTIHWVDLDTENLEVKKLDVPSDLTSLLPIEGTNGFLGAHRTNGKQSFFGIYKFTEDANLKLVAEFPVFDEIYIGLSTKGILSRSADGSALETRDSTSGTLISSAPLQAKYRSGYRISGPRDNFCLAVAGTSFDLVWANGDALHFPSSSNIFALDSSSEFHLIAVGVVRNPGDVVVEVFDTQTLRSLFVRKLNSYQWGGIVIKDKHTLAIFTKTEGVTVEMFDLRTGELIKRITPYRWASWTLLLLVILFTLWAIAWLRASARHKGWAWVDVGLIAGLVLVPIVGRLAFIHDPTDINRLPFNDAQGVLLGLFNVSALWMALGRTRVTLRLLPFLGCTVLLTSILISFFGPGSEHCWLGILTTLIPSVAICLLYRLLLTCGWKLCNMHDKDHAASNSNRVIPIRDFFLLTWCIAIALAVARDMLPHFMTLFRLQPNVWILAGGIACLCGTSVLAMQSSRIFTITICVSTLGLLVLLICYPTFAFSFGSPFIPVALGGPAPHFGHDVVRAIATGMFATIVLVQPYRLRGWHAHF